MRKRSKKSNLGRKIISLTALVCGGIAGLGDCSKDDSYSISYQITHNKIVDQLDSLTAKDFDFLQKRSVSELLDLKPEIEEKNLPIVYLSEKPTHTSNLDFDFEKEIQRLRVITEKETLRKYGVRVKSMKFADLGFQKITGFKDRTYGKQYITYCTKAVEWLSAQPELERFTKDKITWIEPGETSYQKEYVPATIGLWFYEGVQGKLTYQLEGGEIVEQEEFIFHPFGGGAVLSSLHHVDDEGKVRMQKPNEPYIYIATSFVENLNILIVAPFSEVLPLYFYPSLEKYIKGFNSNKSIKSNEDYASFLSAMREFNETTSEPVSAYYAKKFLQQQADPSVQALTKMVDTVLFDLQKRESYKYVLAGMEHIDKFGIDVTLQKIKQDPIGYMNDVKEIHASMN
jgi:hypothetical protein